MVSLLPPEEFAIQARRPNEPLFEFFKRKAAVQIDLSLNQVRLTQAYVKGKKTYLKVVDSSDHLSSPRRSQAKHAKAASFKSPRKSPQKLAAEDKARESVETNRDCARVKELLSSRRFALESAVTQLKGFKKSFEKIKVTTNREALATQVSEVEVSSEQIARELEKLIAANFDAARQIDQLWTQVEVERTQARDEWTSALRFELEKGQAAAEAEILDLKLELEELRATRSDTEIEGKRLKKDLRDLKRTNDEREAYIVKHSHDLAEVNRHLEERNQEIDRLQGELESLQGLVRTQEANYDQQVTDLNHEVQALASHLQAFSQQEEGELALQNEAKEQEILQLQAELTRCQDELNLKLRSSKRDDEARLKELLDLREELAQLRRQQSLTEDTNLMDLRTALQSKETAYLAEVERLGEDLQKSEQYRLKQKNEWADIYTTLKHEIKELRAKVGLVAAENDKLLRQQRSQHDSIDAELSFKAQIDTLRARLKDREGETSALWEVLLELQKTQSQRGKIDFRDLQTLLVIKNLDDKWRRKQR
jgi:chromosome segregation ATPase